MTSRLAKFEYSYFKFCASFLFFIKLIKFQIVSCSSILPAFKKLTNIVKFFTLNCQFIDKLSFDAVTPTPLEGYRIQCDLNLPPPHELFLDLEP